MLFIIETTFHLFHIEPGRVSDIEVTTINENSAHITWNPPETLNGIVLSYHIYLYKVEGGVRTVVEEWEKDYDEELTVKVFNLCKTSH